MRKLIWTPSLAETRRRCIELRPAGGITRKC
jgi:hypothetical protein